MKNWKKISILLLAGAVGFVLVLQIKSFKDIDVMLRDNQTNVFQEIKILKDKNEALKQEVSSLEETVIKFDDQELALSAVEDEIAKYSKLSGKSSIYGTGLTVKIDGSISTFWMIDLINEAFNSGAQAVAINGIRITNSTVGFDTLPQGQILLNGSILSAPYQIELIGEPKVLTEILTIKGGILDRLKAQFPNVMIEVAQREIIQMI